MMMVEIKMKREQMKGTSTTEGTGTTEETGLKPDGDSDKSTKMIALINKPRLKKQMKMLFLWK